MIERMLEMKCPKCGKECLETDEKCKECGAELDKKVYDMEKEVTFEFIEDEKSENDKFAKEDDKEASQKDEDFEIIEEDESLLKENEVSRNRKRIKLILVAFVVLVICSVGCYTFIVKRAEQDKFEAALHNNQYSLAKDLYNDLMDSQKPDANEIIKNKISEIYDRYYKGTIDSKTAIEELKELKKISTGVESDINSQLKVFDRILVSEKQYEEGAKLYEDGKLKESIIAYNKVIPEDTNYKKAQTLLAKVASEYKKEQIEAADEYAAKDDYDNAIAIMNSCLKLLKDDEKISKQLQEYKSKKLSLNISDIFDLVKVQVNKDNYVEAIKLVNNSITEYGSDKRLVDKLEELKKAMFDEVTKYIESERYSMAVGILKSYRRIIVNDEKAEELIKKYSSKVKEGKKLSELEIIRENGKKYVIDKVGEYKDAKGAKYEDVIEVVGYRNLDTKGSMTIKNSGYKTLSGVIGYVSSKQISYYKNGKGKIYIYGDSSKIYESKVLSESSDNEEVDIDISKYGEIRIEWKPADEKDVKMYGIVLGDFNFK